MFIGRASSQMAGSWSDHLARIENALRIERALQRAHQIDRDLDP